MNIYLTVGFIILVIAIFIFIHFMTKDASHRPVEDPDTDDIKDKASSMKELHVSPRTDIDKKNRVIIVGLNIPFWDLVYLMVKIAFAAIPAMFIVAIIWSILINILAHSNF
jgi:hypothetical protein